MLLTPAAAAAGHAPSTRARRSPAPSTSPRGTSSWPTAYARGRGRAAARRAAVRDLLPLADRPDDPRPRARGAGLPDADPVRPAHPRPAVRRATTTRRARNCWRRPSPQLDAHLAEPLADCLAADADGRPCIEAKTPLDLERDLRLPGGNIFHRDLAWPYAQEGTGRWGVETAHANVLLCGAGAVRGGGVSGVPGHNAAMAVLEAARSGSRAGTVRRTPPGLSPGRRPARRPRSGPRPRAAISSKTGRPSSSTRRASTYTPRPTYSRSVVYRQRSVECRAHGEGPRRAGARHAPTSRWPCPPGAPAGPRPAASGRERDRLPGRPVVRRRLQEQGVRPRARCPTTARSAAGRRARWWRARAGSSVGGRRARHAGEPGRAAARRADGDRAGHVVGGGDPGRAAGTPTAHRMHGVAEDDQEGVGLGSRTRLVPVKPVCPRCGAWPSRPCTSAGRARSRGRARRPGKAVLKSVNISSTDVRRQDARPAVDAAVEQRTAEDREVPGARRRRRRDRPPRRG